jgi:hypothetical protein
MNNTIENARQLYISSIKGDRNRIYTTHALLNFGDEAVASNLNCDELFNLMVDYHNAIIQSKIEELEKEMELLDKQDKNLVLLKLLKRNFAINYLKEM